MRYKSLHLDTLLVTFTNHFQHSAAQMRYQVLNMHIANTLSEIILISFSHQIETGNINGGPRLSQYLCGIKKWLGDVTDAGRSSFLYSSNSHIIIWCQSLVICAIVPCCRMSDHGIRNSMMSTGFWLSVLPFCSLFSSTTANSICLRPFFPMVKQLFVSTLTKCIQVEFLSFHFYYVWMFMAWVG